MTRKRRIRKRWEKAVVDLRLIRKSERIRERKKVDYGRTRVRRRWRVVVVWAAVVWQMCEVNEGSRRTAGDGD